MKKKIVFMVINMNIGGTEKALLSMLDEMDKDKYDITILMLEEYGGFLEDIPEWVKVKYVEEYKNIKSLAQNPPMETVKKLFKQGRIIKEISVAFHYCISKMVGSSLTWYRYILRNVKPLKENYDVAVAYAGPMDLITTFINDKISAKHKVQWIHFDVSKISFDEGIVRRLYPKFDKVFVVSEDGKKKLIEKFPSLKKNTGVYFNKVLKDRILKSAKQGDTFNDDFRGIRILTVGRLSKEKGQDLTIPVLSKLKEAGYNVRWYCIGDGSFRTECEKLIKQYRLESDFILLGTKKNPYPYMKDCNIYVQPSRHEGYCITLAEAICFNKPIVATDFTGAREQLNDYDKGLVCNGAEEDIYEGLKIILEDEEFYL